ncbi:hypothetical protein K466DRAFT_609252 [Polyporus arcularius HHB13444]|uniref:Uncharacterized protein n=1 Tax=Polyporus arcularius HHB13444 TaxID=1314778 RepID=A0A5C3NSF2_9APHY|nr:hypothetical protein K466DRAFT_609252 [Polyporus arcularius HHB13444]
MLIVSPILVALAHFSRSRTITSVATTRCARTRSVLNVIIRGSSTSLDLLKPRHNGGAGAARELGTHDGVRVRAAPARLGPQHWNSSCSCFLRGSTAVQHYASFYCRSGWYPSCAAGSGVINCVTSTALSGAGDTGSPVLQLRPNHTSSPSVGQPSSAHVQPAPSPPSSESNYETFSVAMWPFAYPACGTTRAKFPRKTFQLTDWSFGKAVESLEHWGLLFKVTLAKTGSVYRSFGQQVVAQLIANDITLPGYDASRPWRSPLDLPFVLMSSTGRATKNHVPFDGFNELTYTVSNILAAKPSLTVIKCPIGEDFMQHTFLRIAYMAEASYVAAPRFGDLQAPLANHPAYVLGAPGLRDFMSIPGAELLHPCFPFRILSEAVDGLSAMCRANCPTSSKPSSPAGSPIAGPSSRPRPAPRPRRGGASNTPDGPSTVSAPTPLVPQPLPPLEEYTLLNRPPTPPTPQSPRSFLLAGWPLTEAIPPLSLDADEATMPPVSAPVDAPAIAPLVADVGATMTANRDVREVPSHPSLSEVSDSIEVVAPPRRSRRSQRSARMTTGGRPPPSRDAEPETVGFDSPGPEGSVQPEAGTSSMPSGQLASIPLPRGLRRTHSEVGSPEVRYPWFRRPGMHTADVVPLRPALPSRLLIVVGSPVRSPPPVMFLWSRMALWNLTFPFILPAARPHWRKLITMLSSDGRSVCGYSLMHPADPSRINTVAPSKKPSPAISHARMITANWCLSRKFSDMPVTFISAFVSDDALGDSPIRAVMRNLIYLLVAQQKCWLSRGRYATIRWFSRREAREDRDVALRAAGFSSLLHMVVGTAGADPISPHLLLLALLGHAYACRVDEEFMGEVDAGLLESVMPWRTFDITQPLPQEPGHPLICRLSAADIDPEHYGTDPLSPQDVDTIEQDLVSFLVFGARQVQDEPDMQAFIDGFFAAHPDRLALVATFQGETRDILAAMYNKRLESGDLLLRHMHYESGVDESAVDLTVTEGGLTLAEWDQTFEAEFKVAFAYYMQQPGHPDDDGIRALVGSSFDAGAGDRGLRPRMFLTIMSGSDLVPPEDDWQIQITFRHKGTRCPDPPPPPGALGPVPAAIDIHACFYEATVYIDDGLRNLLNQGKPWKAFQAWLHGALLHPEDFNQATSAGAVCELKCTAKITTTIIDLDDKPAPNLHALRAQVIGYAEVIGECSRAIALELDYLHEGLHGSTSPSDDPFISLQDEAMACSSDYDGSSEARPEDHPDAERCPTPEPPWIDWFYGYSSEDPWLWRPLGLIDGPDEDEWPPTDLLELEEAMEVEGIEGEMPWYASQASLERFLEDLGASLPDGVTTDMLTTI